MSRYNYKHCDCPQCGARCGRHSMVTNKPMGLNGQEEHRVAKYHCQNCKKHFSHPAYVKEVIGVPAARYTQDLRVLVLEHLRNKTQSFNNISEHLKYEHGINVPVSTMADWLSVDEGAKWA